MGFDLTPAAIGTLYGDALVLGVTIGFVYIAFVLMYGRLR